MCRIITEDHIVKEEYLKDIINKKINVVRCNDNVSDYMNGYISALENLPDILHYIDEEDMNIIKKYTNKLRTELLDKIY